jgi:hypothetical protein
MISPSAAVCLTVKLPTSLPPAFTVTLASRSLVSVLASAATVYFRILLEAELSAVTLHHSGALLVTSNATFDLMFSVLVPLVLEKVIPSVRMFAGIVISGVIVSSLPEHAATNEEKSSADSTRQVWNFPMIFFIMSLRIKIMAKSVKAKVAEKAKNTPMPCYLQRYHLFPNRVQK